MTGRKVLIVDDDEMNLGMLEMILMDEGISHIDKACNGMEALELYEDALFEHPYSAVFLDINMPVMDGQEVLKRIRAVEDDADYRATIIMATIDNSQETVVKSMLRHDADDHVCKPYNREEIHESLVRNGLLSEEQ
jgi:CheY-like chemotaxis protein